MYYIALLSGYEKLHLSINNFPKKLTPEIWGLLDKLVNGSLPEEERKKIKIEITQKCKQLKKDKLCTT